MLLRHASLLSAVASVCCTAPLSAAITPVAAGAEAYFGSQGTAYMDANPFTIFAPPPIGPYAPAGVGVPLPNVPAPVVAPVFPGAPAGNNYFVPGGDTFNFNDNFGGTTQFTAATATIDHIFNPAGVLTSDAAVDFPFWQFAQGPVAPSYAYMQINFAQQYLVNNSLGASTPGFSYLITGSNSGLGTPYAQFDAAVTYTWVPLNSSMAQTGPATNLGTLYFAWQSSGAGSFATTVTSTGSLAATPTAFGMLELTGYAYIGGDPFAVTLTAVPEPGMLTLVGVALAAASRRRRMGQAMSAVGNR